MLGKSDSPKSALASHSRVFWGGSCHVFRFHWFAIDCGEFIPEGFYTQWLAVMSAVGVLAFVLKYMIPSDTQMF